MKILLMDGKISIKKYQGFASYLKAFIGEKDFRFSPRG